MRLAGFLFLTAGVMQAAGKQPIPATCLLLAAR
jgi:hypothetical protein